MANDFERGMDDAFLGEEIKGNDPGLEYLLGYGYAESLYKEQSDDRCPEQPDDRIQEQPNDDK